MSLSLKQLRRSFNFRGQPQSFFSSIQSPALVRDFIDDRLYNPDEGYFCRQDLQIGEMKGVIDFQTLIGYDDYQRKLIELYPKNAWLTPSEIFQPYYGMTVANYIHQCSEYLIKRKEISDSQNIQIVEVGPGSGTAAQSILLFFKNYEQSFYQNLQYTLVEVSPQLCKIIQAKLYEQHRRLFDKGQIRIVNDNFINFKAQNKNDHHFILFFEVLDNMPHDRVYLNKELEFEYQAMVQFSDKKGSENLVETQEQVTDPLIIEIGDIIKKNQSDIYSKFQDQQSNKGVLQKILKWYFKNDQSNVFIPTFLYQTLKHINWNFPKHHLIMADFDLLKNAQSTQMGINAPVVSQQKEQSHEKIDFQTYLVKRGEADIFFPTNFQLLQHMYQNVTKKESQVFQTHEFMNLFSRNQWTETRSGYNPLQEDFANTSFFVTQEK